VLLLLASPATDARHVREAYLTAQLRRTAFDPDVRARVERLASGRRTPTSDRRVIETPPQPGSRRPLAEPPEQPAATGQSRDIWGTADASYRTRRRTFRLIQKSGKIPPAEDP
jgi:hypothetical protein